MARGKARIPRAPKGGAPKVTNMRPENQAPPKLTVEQMLADKHLYHDQMWKVGQVKTPKDMEVVPEFLQQLDFFKSFSDVQVVCPVMEKFETTYGGHQSYEECMETAYDNNLMILLEQLISHTFQKRRRTKNESTCL